MPDRPVGERLVRLESQLESLRDDHSRTERDVDRLWETHHTQRKLESDVDRLQGEFKAHEKEFGSIREMLDHIKREMNGTIERHKADIDARILKRAKEHNELSERVTVLDTWVKSRWWALVAIATFASTVGGWALQVAIKAIF